MLAVPLLSLVCPQMSKSCSQALGWIFSYGMTRSRSRFGTAPTAILISTIELWLPPEICPVCKTWHRDGCAWSRSHWDKCHWSDCVEYSGNQSATPSFKIWHLVIPYGSMNVLLPWFSCLACASVSISLCMRNVQCSLRHQACLYSHALSMLASPL